MRRVGALLIVALTAAGTGACGGSAAAGTTTVELVIHHSRFRPDHVTVPRGRTVHFVVRNQDPIDHELIVGDDAVQLRHEKGTEPHHGAVPGEVSVAAGAVATTTYVFAASGPVPFGCHLPGHWNYGMRGQARVL
jgi:uncharacterized cupredoxin-like copper-binding protein